jgi:hypothetical protein
VPIILAVLTLKLAVLLVMVRVTLPAVATLAPPVPPLGEAVARQAPAARVSVRWRSLPAEPGPANRAFAWPSRLEAAREPRP